MPRPLTLRNDVIVAIGAGTNDLTMIHSVDLPIAAGGMTAIADIAAVDMCGRLSSGSNIVVTIDTRLPYHTAMVKLGIPIVGVMTSIARLIGL